MNTPDPVNDDGPERAAAAGSASGWGLSQTIGTKLYPGLANEAADGLNLQ
jgi:hypothetical protein